jgi:hypothetical protein
VKDFDPNAHVKVFKVAIKTNVEIKNAEIVNIFSFTFKDTISDWCNNYIGNYPEYTFAKL